MQETAQELTARHDHDVTALHIGAGGRTPVKSLKKSSRIRPKPNRKISAISATAIPPVTNPRLAAQRLIIIIR